ncbi:MAG: mannose-1-phosphate guanylyltransferase/mannose-6-phosphate isomerase [Proteobacteria bacterium]|nr:mannose-1-phosphate guanylyltransferase/mannose-6-phosphate isomerase [Pseudomonadota bacterium]MBU4298240.1 mannose-1-phosphate guanylyltransferase/mannose-6-phosphate isomerase [Pseudomonadota bacterium]MCG2747508.1 mannose-1-phosphate guanylyltransferase/mannose-6-phosphate isomerase [Desulfobulbaceae bacterium]
MPRIQPIILAGGSGSRLWPLSRELYPKQLLNLTEDCSLLQSTLKRLENLTDSLPPVVVVGEAHRFLTLNQIKELGQEGQVEIILEPLGRNTAPAICAAALYCRDRVEEDLVLLVLPADHLIRRPQSFQEAVDKAVNLAGQGRLVTFGITPNAPETGYGYIEKGDGNSVLSFVEKPDLQKAKEYLAAGNFFWNSGMFAFTAGTFLTEMEKLSPEIYTSMGDAVDHGTRDKDFFRLDRESMKKCPDDSIDYAMMENSALVSVIPADLGWSDIGSWQAFWEVAEKDGRGNVLHGDVIAEDLVNSFVRSENRLVAAVGLRDMLVVETADAVLVAPINRSQEIKKIVNRLKTEGREEHILHRTVYRPWGSYTILEEQAAFKIKRITVNSGVKLSLQMHHHRSEHWVVVRGTAKVTCGEKVFLVLENQSTYIPCGERHRLENPGVIPLELIEVQNGSYLGEDDIVRFDDDFGREGTKV